MPQLDSDRKEPRASVRDAVLRQSLLDRRERLRAAAPATAAAAPRMQLQDLLREVDAALERMDAGTFGLCEVCHDPVENDRLLADPLTRYCIDHLSPAEQRALQTDLDLAFQVQRGLLPAPDLAVAGWDVAYAYEPAGPVSGDYCDLIPLGPGTALFALGDVAGKGVAASILMANLHAIFRSLAGGTPALADLVGKANRVFCQNAVSSHFATLVCGRLGADGGAELCNAGHCLPLHASGQGVTRLVSTDLPLGVIADGAYQSQSVKLGSGESLVLYSDGLSEAFDAGGNQYGTSRLVELLGRSGRAGARELVRAILEDVKSFRAGGPKGDDLTVMVVRRV